MQRNSSGRRSSGAPLLFYDSDKPYFEFTNAASYPIIFEGKIYPTAEHLYNARKFFDGSPNLAERIRNARSPRAAIDESKRLERFQRADWSTMKIAVMEEVLEAKFVQHTMLRDLLLGTGDRELIDTSHLSAFWGIGRDRQGRNELGKALMRLREKLRDGAAAARPPNQQRASSEAILFHDPNKPFYEFTNSSAYSVFYEGKIYPTAEHLYQAMKFLTNAPGLAEQVRLQPTPQAALREGQRYRSQQRNDWLEVNVSCMESLLEAKFTQHPNLRTLLLGTQEREIVNANSNDAFWGLGPDRKGRNELGKCLMRLRARLQVM